MTHRGQCIRCGRFVPESRHEHSPPGYPDYEGWCEGECAPGKGCNVAPQPRLQCAEREELILWARRRWEQ